MQQLDETLNSADAPASSEQLALLVDEEDDRHFDMKSIVKNETRSNKTKRRRAKKTQQPVGTAAVAVHACLQLTNTVQVKPDVFEVDVKDDRFAALYASHDYSIDPTNPSFVKTKNMDKLLDERRERITSKKRSKAKRGPEGKLRGLACMHPALPLILYPRNPA